MHEMYWQSESHIHIILIAKSHWKRERKSANSLDGINSNIQTVHILFNLVWLELILQWDVLTCKIVSDWLDINRYRWCTEIGNRIHSNLKIKRFKCMTLFVGRWISDFPYWEIVAATIASLCALVITMAAEKKRKSNYRDQITNCSGTLAWFREIGIEIFHTNEEE